MSLVGLPALQALLYHCCYFQHVAFCASNCYQGRSTFHSHLYGDAGGDLLPRENTLLGMWDIKPLTYFQPAHILKLICSRLIRFRGFAAVLEKCPGSVHRQPQETFQLAVHVQHSGQPTPPLHTSAKIYLVYILFLLCFTEQRLDATHPERSITTDGHRRHPSQQINGSRY